MTSSLPVVAVVGGGFAGTALALRLQGAARVLLFEPGAPGPGLAYSTEAPEHLLNVPAGGMSLWPERPADFAEWLARQPEAPAVPAGGGPVFAPRYLYGRYLRAAWQEAARMPGSTLTHHPRRAVAVERRPEGGFRLRDEIGDWHAAERVALAPGGFAGGPGEPPWLFGDPWDPAALEGLAPDAPVLLVGTGLTMVDMVLSLRRRGHQGPLVAVSRHGWLPLPHVQGALPAPWPVPLAPGRVPGPLALLRRLRAEAAGAAAAGQPWQAVPDGLRPQLQAIWQSWSAPERARFLRHGASLWNLHRHRLAPEVSAALAEALAEGGLRVLAGRLESWRPGAEGQVEAILRLRGGQRQPLRCARILLCTGPSGSRAWAASPPVSTLIEGGMLRPDGLGLSVSPDGKALDAQGQAVPGLFLLGPLARGALWEITAVPEIRVQAAKLAEAVLSPL